MDPEDTQAAGPSADGPTDEDTEHTEHTEGIQGTGNTDGTGAAEGPPEASLPPEPHSGYRLAKRYRLEECITRLDGFSGWRAVDEKLRRAVGVHVLPVGHERSDAVLSAARSAALVGDLRFVQVLDAAEEHGLVHVIHEWLPDAVPLSTVLHTGPLDPFEVYALASQVSQAMAAAHRKDLAHLRLTPATVLRTGPGQFRIRGLAVDAALRGITSREPRRADTEAIGALLYAALTQRWPYGDGAYGLRGVAGLGKGSRDPLATPEQVRAGVHRGLSELAMRALDNNGATAASHELPFTTPEELSQTLATLPRIPPPDPTPTDLVGYQHTTYQRGTLTAHRASAVPPAGAVGTAAVMPALPGRTGAALKWGVSALLIAALGLGSWQLADALLKGDAPAEASSPAAPPAAGEDDPPVPELVTIEDVTEFDPYASGSGGQNPEDTPHTIDGDPASYWQTSNYYGPSFGNLKPGLGLVLDLGESRRVSSITVDAIGETTVEFRAAPGADSVPATIDGFTSLAEDTGDSLTLSAETPVETRFVLVWLTELPQGSDGNYRGRITNIAVAE